MKKTIYLAIVAVFALAFKPVEIQNTWGLDKSHAKLGFSITHLSISEVEGSFKTFDSKITAGNEDFSDAVVELTADVNSISTDNEMRDGHIKNADYLNAAKYPLLTFKSTGFKKTAERTYTVTGNLTLRGVTKPVDLKATYGTTIHPMTKKPVAGFKVTGVIKRTDFGIATGTPSAMLSDEITLNANIEYTKN